MEYFFNEYGFAGFFSVTTFSMMTTQDVLLAVVLGFFGGLGGFLFKIVKDLIKDHFNKHDNKRKDPYRSY